MSGIRSNFIGNFTCCGTQAILTAYGEKIKFSVPDFELLTTVPFGVKHDGDDPYRFLSCYYDPDFGISRALETLNIKHEVFSSDSEDEAKKLLDSWAFSGSFVIGPLNMDDLNYIFRAEMFYRMVHYVVVLHREGNVFWISDPEGFILTKMDLNSLLKAWKGDKIPEGRGNYVARRISDFSQLKNDKEQYLITTLSYIVGNMVNAEKDGQGTNAIREVLNKISIIENDVSIQRRLTFDLPIRIQRVFLAKNFINTVNVFYKNKQINKITERMQALLDTQITIYSMFLKNVRIRDFENYEKYIKLVEAEKLLLEGYSEMRNIV